jgi:thioredoxin-dependent peroxiredoxin
MESLKIGTAAPPFEGINENGEQISLNDYRGRKLVIFIYPQDDTPGCTAEACSLRDSYGELRERGFELLGISADTAQKHTKFKTKYNLPFSLLADTEHKVLEAYQAWGEKKFIGRVYDGIHRKTYVINEDGIIERVFDKVETSDHAAQILATYA